ncbi:MAG TPA: NHL repeat-containing protein [Candidatus Cybelea sp.]|nr:NHL repeat-containing protein [Candidatus Cybelea sp.]
MSSKRAPRGARIVALMALAACTAHGESAIPPVSLQRPPATFSRVNAGGAMLYVSDPVGNDVAVYHASGSKQSPIATITQGIAGPAGMAVDGKGNLFVANTTGNSVTEYAPNGTSPEATYSQSVLGPVDVAVDGAGTLYVANFYSFAASVVEFPSGSRTPSVTIGDPCSCYPVGLALDAKGDLYVAYDDYYEQTLIYKYAPGSSKGVSLGLQFSQLRWEAPGLAFDKSANLLVANATLPGVQIYPAGKLSPSKTLEKRGSPRFLAFDSTENNVFVTDTSKNAVEEYAYPSGHMTNVITNGLKSVYGVAVSPP